MAKAVEDTAFYRWNRLIALNEVGGDPSIFGTGTAAFHQAMLQPRESSSTSLSTTATHDTKRGEDSRARLYALSEQPGRWQEAVQRWHGMIQLPVDAEIEWLFYQSLLGAWPADMDLAAPGMRTELHDRMKEFIRKAVREAKTHTSWASPNEGYEKEVLDFVAAALGNEAFLGDLHQESQRYLIAGAVNSLAQLAIKLTAPGIPDIYQGTEFWDLNLVDPDNRRPVDFQRRIDVFPAVLARPPTELVGHWRSGLIKMRLLHAGLQLRGRHSNLLRQGAYRPVTVHGPANNNIIAFARDDGDDTVLTAVPRFPMALLNDAPTPLVPSEAWSGSFIEIGRDVTDIVTGRSCKGRQALADILGAFPVAILESRRVS
jgi:(1->4)-alpha-D-glucan 1-alpha-D-glucosylmutase